MSGLDVDAYNEEAYKKSVSEWVKRQKADEAREKYILKLLRTRPTVRDLSLDDMQSQLDEIISACSDIEYMMNGDREALRELTGDYSGEFEMACVYLGEDAQAFYEKMFTDCYDEDSAYQHFNDFLVFIAKGTDRLEIYDDGVNNYGYLRCDEYQEEYAVKASETRLNKLTKKALLELSQECFGIVLEWLEIKADYERLSSTMDILRGETGALLAEIRKIEQLYEKADKVNWYDWKSEVREFDRIISMLPDTMWVE